MFEELESLIFLLFLYCDDFAKLNVIYLPNVARLLRLLATHHIFAEVAPDTFANNRLSLALDTGKSVADILARPDEKYDGSSGLAALIALTSVP